MDNEYTPFRRGQRAGRSAKTQGGYPYIYGSIVAFVEDHTIEEVREYMDGIELGYTGVTNRKLSKANKVNTG